MDNKETKPSCRAVYRHQTCINIIVDDVNEYTPVFTSLIYISQLPLPTTHPSIPTAHPPLPHPIDHPPLPYSNKNPPLHHPTANPPTNQDTPVYPIPLFRVQAIDRDGGMFGKVRYSISPSNWHNGNNHFNSNNNNNNHGGGGGGYNKSNGGDNNIMNFNHKNYHDRRVERQDNGNVNLTTFQDELRLRIDGQSGEVFVVGSGWRAGRYNFVVVAQDAGSRNATVAAVVFVAQVGVPLHQQLPRQLHQRQLQYRQFDLMRQKAHRTSNEAREMAANVVAHADTTIAEIFPSSSLSPHSSSYSKSFSSSFSSLHGVVDISTSHLIMILCFLMVLVICTTTTIVSFILRRRSSTKNPSKQPINHLISTHQQPTTSSLDTLSVSFPHLHNRLSGGCDEEVMLINQSSLSPCPHLNNLLVFHDNNNKNYDNANHNISNNSNNKISNNNNISNISNNDYNDISNNNISNNDNNVEKCSDALASFRVISSAVSPDDDHHIVGGGDDDDYEGGGDDNDYDEHPSQTSLLRHKLNGLPASSVWKMQGEGLSRDARNCKNSCCNNNNNNNYNNNNKNNNNNTINFNNEKKLYISQTDINNNRVKEVDVDDKVTDVREPVPGVCHSNTGDPHHKPNDPIKYNTITNIVRVASEQKSFETFLPPMGSMEMFCEEGGGEGVGENHNTSLTSSDLARIAAWMSEENSEHCKNIMPSTNLNYEPYYQLNVGKDGQLGVPSHAANDGQGKRTKYLPSTCGAEFNDKIFTI